MTLIAYGREKKIGADRLRDIGRANKIIDDMAAQGYTLTLRQLYYQFVSKNFIANTERSYKNLGNLITDGRMAGLISWDAIEDRGRGVLKWGFEETEEGVLAGLERELVFDLWDRQPNYVEVWIEKDALSNVLSRPCEALRVPHMACKGYLSASEAWRAGNRFREAADRGQHPVLIHLGDHDPSGIDMTRDNGDRLEVFVGEEVEVRRIALNIDQVRRYRPPPNPTKVLDSRTSKYVSQFGRECWELDALQPRVIDELITETVTDLIDPDIWKETLAEEKVKRRRLAALSEYWGEVVPIIDGIIGPEGEE